MRSAASAPRGAIPADWGPIEADARAVAEAGAFSVVLEALAEPLAAQITARDRDPHHRHRGEPACDGQVLVLEDMLGLSPWVPKFVKRYTSLGPSIEPAIASYAAEVRGRTFPGPEHVYAMKKG